MLSAAILLGALGLSAVAPAGAEAEWRVDVGVTVLREARDFNGATETLGGSTWVYWRRVAAPILFPSFVGATLLLFTNAFSAYATAAALVSQGSPLLPLAIGNTLTSEVILGQENIGKAMALEMVVVVAVAMTLYAVLDRRSSKWLAP